MSENMLPCFSSVTHTMWARPTCAFLGLRLNFLSAVIAARPWVCLPPHDVITPPFAEWLNGSFWPGSVWRGYDGGDDDGGAAADARGVTLTPLLAPSPLTEEPSQQETLPEFWGWWGGASDLSQWTRTESKMYRTQTFLSVNPFCLMLSSFWNDCERRV